MADPVPGAPENPAPSPPMAANVQQGQLPIAAPSPAAGQSAPLFGGLRGGRKRKDGLTPGSPEALAADREKDRLRKEKQRDAKPKDPAPLPSVAGTPQAPGDNLGPVPGIEAGAPVPWDPNALRPLFEQLIPACEELAVSQITTRAAKAKLPREVIGDIEKEGRWSKPAKSALELAGPQLAAKWLNKTGISAENQPEVIFGTAVATIAVSHMRLIQRLDALIVTAKPGNPIEKNTETKEKTP